MVFLKDFAMIGSKTHTYTSRALFNESQRVKLENLSDGEKGVIFLVIRAKIFAEAVASMETLGKFVYAVKHRASDGIASLYIMSGTDKSENGLRTFLKTEADENSIDSILSILKLPPLEQIKQNFHEKKFEAFLVNLATKLNKIQKAFFENEKGVVRAYEKVKHGACISMIYPPSDEHGTDDAAHLCFITRWPKRNEKKGELHLKHIPMTTDSVMTDIEICAMISDFLSTLSKILVRLLELGQLPY